MSKLEKLYKYILYALLIWTAALFIWVGLRDDGVVHFNRICCIADNIKTQGFLGQIQSKIYYSSIDNFGYAFPMMYGDILLYPFALLELIVEAIGVKTYFVWNLFMITMMISSMVSFRYFIGKIYNKDAVKLAQLLYVLAPYFDYYLLRQSAGEMIQYVIYPMIFYSFSQILNYDKNKFNKTGYIWLTAGMQLLLLNHIISAYLVCWILLVWCIYRYKEILEPGRIKTILAQAITTIALTSYFIFPLIEQLLSGYMVISNTQNDLYNPVQLTVFQLFMPQWLWKIIEIVSGADLTWLHGNGWSPAYTGLMLVAIFQIIRRNKNSKAENKSEYKKYLLMMLVILIAQTPLVRLQNKLFQMIQFPFRILEIVQFLILVFLVKNWDKVTGADIKKITSMTLLSVQLIQLEICFIYQDYTRVDGSMDLQVQIGTGCEYMPYSQKYNEFKDKKQISFDNVYDFDMWVNDAQQIEVQSEIIKNGYRITKFEDKITDTGQLKLPILYYKGYQAFDENGNQLSIVEDDIGVIEVADVKKDCSEIKILYTGTDIQHISWIVCIISWVIFMIYIGSRYIIIKKLRREND